MNPTSPSCPENSHSANPRSEGIRLSVTGIGHVIPFKNRKRAILDRKTGKMRTLTEPKVAQWMERATEAIVLKLFSSCQTGDAATQRECLSQLRTFLCGLSDDSVKQLPMGSWEVEYVEKGDEGFELVIGEIKGCQPVQEK